MYNTKDLTYKHRVPEAHGSVFNTCEHCGYDSNKPNTAFKVEYYHYYKLALCDRCLDKSNYPDHNYWEDEEAEECGFPVPFQYPAPLINEKAYKELKEYKKMKGYKYYE